MPTLSSAPLKAAINCGPTQDGNALCNSTADITPLAATVAIQGAQGYLNLYFQADGGVQGGTPINQRLADTVTTTFTGKPTNDIGATTILFQALGFTEQQDAENLYYYQAYLDLDREEIVTAFGLIDGDTLECSVDINLKVAATGGAPALLGIYRITLQLLRQVYTGDESSPTPATPAYPTPGAVAALVSPYQITATTGAVTIPAGTLRAALPASLTGNVVLTLPLSTGYANGQELVIEFAGTGAGGVAYSVSVVPQGSDMVAQQGAGDQATILFTAPFPNRAALVTDGAGNWQPLPDGLTLAQTNARYALLVNAPFAPAITSVGNGAAGSLEDVPTIPLTPPILRTVYDAPNDILGDWLLVASTAATSTDTDGKPAVQRPTDFNSSTNAKVWFRKR